MMKLLRNPEIWQALAAFVFAGMISSLLLWYCFGLEGVFVGLCGCLLYILLYLIFTGKRYRQIENLTIQLDAVLHEEASNLLEDCREGELAILHSELEKLLLRLREQSEQLQMDKIFLAEALADISHQMKTPLTSIRLILERLNEPELEIAERRKMIREIIAFIERIDWLVYALLKMSRLDAGAVQLGKEKILVRRLIQKAMEPLAISMDIRGILWECDITDEISFLGDPDWSEEALTNILKNCMEYTPEGGRIIVTARDNAIYTGLTIRDTGSDIPAEDLPHLFERFYRGSHPSGNGIGIGLSLAQRIIQSQNGTIRVSNHAEGGPVFEIRFYKSVI